MIDAGDILKVASTILKSPGNVFWTRYDKDADVLYVNFEKPSVATDSQLTDQDVIVRYRGAEVIGFTVLHASKRRSA
ncbi:MAG: DUF2283 domain-containing protein [Rhodospirillales bacterium]|nr:DUF2283 domain-containing protein [Rhodospirillales bacterium]